MVTDACVDEMLNCLFMQLVQLFDRRTMAVALLTRGDALPGDR